MRTDLMGENTVPALGEHGNAALAGTYRFLPVVIGSKVTAKADHCRGEFLDRVDKTRLPMVENVAPTRVNRAVGVGKGLHELHM